MADMRRRRPEPPAGRPRVVRRHGLAKAMLAELAPLLVEEGIDVDHLDDYDRDELQQALNRAVERRNLELFSPVGAVRAIAVDTLKAVVDAVVAGDSRRAGQLLEKIQPESPDNSVATVASCIGIALGLLDDTLTAPAAPTAKLPAGQWHGERAATDILALAGTGEAFRSLDQLLVRHGGHQVLYGSALGLAATITATAAATDTPPKNVAEALIH